MAVLSPAARECPAQRNRLVCSRFIVCVVLAAGLSARSVRAQTVADEYQVKAAYLLNFARFVEWPAAVLPASTPLEIGIVGNDPFGVALEEVLRGKSANGHPIHLRHLRWDEVMTSCQIIFISSSEEGHLPQILRQLGQNSVLTVSDIDRFSLRGGIIEFRMVGNRVRFDINREPANAARLSISSKLLSVARAIHEGSASR
jgi:hypothetical protein